MTRWGLLDFKDKEKGIQEVVLNVKKLMEDRFKEFLSNFHDFSGNGDCDTNQVCRMEGDFLIYETESIHPKERKTGRTPILLLFGNPAPCSVKNRMFFSYERNGKEHRFWKVLSDSGLFRLDEQIDVIKERNRLKKRKLLEVTYKPPFQIYLDVFYSMPSPTIGKWSGVAGLKRLFGVNSFKKISESEKERVESLIKNHIGPKGMVLTFQKDAYERIKSEGSPDYDHKKTLAGGIESKCQITPQVKLYCLAPTRLMYNNCSTLKKLTSPR